jgi:hypothetical protein
MHKGIPDQRHNLADRRQFIASLLSAAVCANSVPASGNAVHGSQIENFVLLGSIGKVPASGNAVHGSQIENFVLLGSIGKVMSAVIAAYTLFSWSSVAVPARVPRRACSLRSSSNLLIVAGS